MTPNLTPFLTKTHYTLTVPKRHTPYFFINSYIKYFKTKKHEESLTTMYVTKHSQTTDIRQICRCLLMMILYSLFCFFGFLGLIAIVALVFDKSFLVNTVSHVIHFLILDINLLHIFISFPTLLYCKLVAILWYISSQNNDFVDQHASYYISMFYFATS